MNQKSDWIWKKYVDKRLCFVIEVFLILYWTNFLSQTSAHYIIYLLCSGLAFCSLGTRINGKTQQICQSKILILACVLTLPIILGNYDIFQMSGEGRGLKLFRAGTLFCSSLIVFYNIFWVAYDFFLKFEYKVYAQVSKKGKICFFFIPFIVFALIDFIYLFFAVYPGVLTPDSFNQLRQIESGIYSNHHPFYHTMLIKFFYGLGMNLFHDANAAVATYFVFQIILMSLALAYVTLTVYEITASKKCAVPVILYYALMPYFWNYSCTMWKDVIFGIAVAVFVVSLYRCRKKIGNEFLNDGLFFLSAVVFCLFRSNGIFVYTIVLLGFAFLLRKEQKKLWIISIVALVWALIMKGPVLNILGVSQPDLVEALSIPEQQIARVIYNEKYIDDIDLERLNKVVDVAAVKENYKPYISDPIKSLIRKSSGNEILVDHKLEYLSLWVRLGIRYPMTYVAAWIEQTKGYWNAGYDYMFCVAGITQNELGIFRVTRSELFYKFTTRIITVIQHNSVLCILVSIGLCFWLYLIMFWFNIASKRDGWIEMVPFIAIVISLCIATPVFAEFRYSYALYAAIPFVIFSSMLSSINPIQ